MDPNQIGQLASAGVPAQDLIQGWQPNFSKVEFPQPWIWFHLKDCWPTSHNVRLEVERAMSHNSRINLGLNFLLAQSLHCRKKTRGHHGPLDSMKGMVIVLGHGHRWNQEALTMENKERSCGDPVQLVS